MPVVLWIAALLGCDVAVSEFPAAQAEASCQVLEVCEVVDFTSTWGNLASCTSLATALAGEELASLPTSCVFDGVQGRACLAAIDAVRATCTEQAYADAEAACRGTFSCGGTPYGLGGVIVPPAALKGD